MPGRSVKVEAFPLTSDTTRAPMVRPVTCRHVFVSFLNPAYAGLVRLAIDGTDVGTLREGRKFVACDGEQFENLAVSSPALAGVIELTCSGADTVPFDGGGGGASDVRRLVEDWYFPTTRAAAGSAFDSNGILLPATFFNGVIAAGAGGPPVMTVKDIRCVRCVPNAGGSSGAALRHSIPWARLRTELGAGGGTLLSRVSPRVLSFNLEFLLSCDAQGNSHGGGGAGSGMMFMQGDGTLASSLSGNIAGFGVVRDGVAGGNAWWRFVSRAIDGPGFNINTPLPKPTGADVRSWTKFRVEVADADPVAGRDGRVNVYVNDLPALAFGDADMANFPPSSNAAARTGIDPQLLGESQQVDALCFARGHFWIDSQLGGDA